jgi:NAD(P)-dependent dehydrogenase (short-subunit alcohol dehydrogenase family)
MKTALVTGANRCLGLEFTRQLANDGYHVIATARDRAKARALNELAAMHEHIQIETLDVTLPESIAALANILKDTSIDLLVNNAGTSGESGVTVGNIDKENFLNVFTINCFGVVKMCEQFLPMLKRSDDKQVLVVSSRMGSISDNDSGKSYAYRASKAALNAVMKSFAIDVKEQGIKVMLIHPGWVRTDMGGDNGLVDVTESVSGMLKQLSIHGGKSHAEVLHRFDGETISW